MKTKRRRNPCVLKGRGLAALLFAAVNALIVSPSIASAQTTDPSGTTQTMEIDAGRPLAKAVSLLQRRFLSPIGFEEVPFENEREVKSAAVASSGKPTTAFSVTLGESDSTPYFATLTTLQAYRNSGLPGAYAVVFHDDWISVLPAQVTGADGKTRDVSPVMTQRVTIPMAERKGIDTLQLLADGLSRASGKRVLILNTPFWPTDRIALGADNESAESIVQRIGKLMNRALSYQCLYDPPSKTYYLNISAVVPDPVPGTTDRGRYVIKPGTERQGPAGSPWFSKEP